MDMLQERRLMIYYYRTYSLLEARSNSCYQQIQSCFLNEYNYRLSIEVNHTLSYLLIKQDTEIHVRN